MRCTAPEAFRIALLDIFMALRNQNMTREQVYADSRNRLSRLSIISRQTISFVGENRHPLFGIML
ncbi:hypothetical protein A4A58_14725 [Tardiphaga robiniae]|uniref:Uncharacterized protein n=1 Tax=Tardiphaga robiniae TaxID=943830 RepID=A0A163XL34_9BRAD|nr:hypothetical protein A4A58_14725 [Tardiphaga robiniae]